MTKLARPKIWRLLPAAAVFLLAACDTEPPPRSVSELIENPMLLEAAVVRCARNREATRYEAECMNAREAVMIVEAREAAAHRAELEAESERKRQALRRTQQAAAEARRRAEEERRRREEEEYLAQFADKPTAAPSPEDQGQSAAMTVAPLPGKQAPRAAGEPGAATENSDFPPARNGNAPVAELDSGAQDGADLEAIRDELRRRGEKEGS